MPPSEIIAAIPIIDDVLETHAAALGHDVTGYRNHTYRVANLCVALAPRGHDRLETIAVAAAFHDLGIWTAGTFDYIAPSVASARHWLALRGHEAWSAEVAAMIVDHHKVFASTADPASLVEPFRQADWIDVLWGMPRFGLPRSFVRDVRTRWPDAGFHARLLQLTRQRLLTHPLSPLPMVKL